MDGVENFTGKTNAKPHTKFLATKPVKPRTEPHRMLNCNVSPPHKSKKTRGTYTCPEKKTM